MNKIDRILENLNEQQLQAVTTTEGYVRVIAGAGSGKTKALTSRYAYLVESLGINASNILCVTFTNKAANEMRNRVKQIIGDDKDYGYIATYHGFCVKVLREDINKIQYPKQFVIMDVEDQKTVLKDIYEELELTSKDFSYKEAIERIRDLKIKTNYVEFIAKNKDVKKGSEVLKDNPDIDILDKIFLRYLEKQQRNFALDFDDLINFTLYIFNNYNDVLEKWQKRLHYIMVDEFQDSSRRQYHFVDLLSQAHKNLFVVGDPDQTIYEWRGASPELLVDFHIKYPDTQTVIMNQNYRSTPNILNLGNHIIKNNKMRVDKDMFTTNSEGVDVVHYHAENDFDEGLFVATEIQRIVKEENKKYSDFTVLYRAKHVSRTIEQSLIKQGIPYSIWGGIRFFERAEIKNVLSYLRLIVFGDDLSFLRIINTPSRKLGKVFINEIKQIAEQNNITLFEAIESNPLNRESAVEFVDLIKEFRIRKDEISVSDLVQEILDKTGLTEMYRADGDEERLNNIMELQNSIIFLETDDVEKLTLENYLQEVALYTDMDIDNKKNDMVKLLTIHSAKGLEFPYVFLCGFTDGVLPNYRSTKADKIEEERRLVYVAITRAEKAFYMTESEGFNFETGMRKYPSRFLLEIKENLFVRQGILPKEIIDAAKKQFKSGYSAVSHSFATFNKSKPISVFEVGDFVYSSAWGKGEVMEKDDETKTYSIKFEKIDAVRPIRFDWKGLVKLNKDKTLNVRDAINLSKDIDLSSEINYEENAIVHHDKFGKGVIKSVEGKGEKLVVLFDEVGEKYLLAKFANLKIL